MSTTATRSFPPRSAPAFPGLHACHLRSRQHAGNLRLSAPLGGGRQPRSIVRSRRVSDRDRRQGRSGRWLELRPLRAVRPKQHRPAPDAATPSSTTSARACLPPARWPIRCVSIPAMAACRSTSSLKAASRRRQRNFFTLTMDAITHVQQWDAQGSRHRRFGLVGLVSPWAKTGVGVNAGAEYRQEAAAVPAG